ncbi:MAG: type II toxin-antitoxin system VapC family toxin [Treponema sp.]|nr:type II toxin-antitoxin system VapC family toxin [Treponema sp.]
MNILIDASALMPVLIDEQDKGQIIAVTKGHELLVPSVLPYEIGNALTRLKKRQILNDRQVLAVYKEFLKIPLRFMDIEIEKALQIACKYNIYAYDAYYLETAYRLDLPLLTLDSQMKKIAIDINIRILEVTNESL